MTVYAAVAGYPHLTVPMGLVEGMPVGLSFIGTAWTEAKMLAYGYAYEQGSHARVCRQACRSRLRRCTKKGRG